MRWCAVVVEVVVEVVPKDIGGCAEGGEGCAEGGGACVEGAVRCAL